MKIGSSNNSEAVKAQYSTSKGLDIRIAFHDKYSTNKQGYGLTMTYEKACAFLKLGVVPDLCGLGMMI